MPYTLKEAAKELGISYRTLLRNIEDEKIPHTGFRETAVLDDETIETIRWQKDNLVGIVSIIDTYGNGKLDTRKVNEIRKYLNYLLESDCYGCRLFFDHEVYFEHTAKNVAYFLKDDVPLIVERSQSFLDDFGYTTEELIEQQLGAADKKDFGPDYRAFMTSYDYSSSSPNYFLEVLRTLNALDKPLASCTNDEISQMKDSFMLAGSSDMLIRFLHYFKDRHKTEYKKIIKTPKAVTALTVSRQAKRSAYSDEVITRLAGYVFNEDYIREHHLLEKALDKSMDAEMWLYISCFFVCDWRPGDIVSKWGYLEWRTAQTAFPQIDWTTIRDDVLEGRYSTDLYIRLCDYVTKKMELNNAIPGKTADRNPGSLKVGLAYSNMRAFFGRLYLILEYHNITSGEGRMKATRRSTYANRCSLEEFFGKSISTDVLGRDNFVPTKMNKSFSQAIEQAARLTGHGAVMAHALASFARSHTSIETMTYYLSDHGFDGETPAYVMEQMMERGAWSSLKSNAFSAMLPKDFGMLPEEAKTRILQQADLTPLEMETVAPLALLVNGLRESLGEGEGIEAKRIYMGLSDIMQGFHRGKHEGCGCLAIAMGYECPHLAWDCIADACEFCIATELALPALYDVIKGMSDRYKATHDAKIKAVYQKKIVPAFKEMLDLMFARLTEEEKSGLLITVKEKKDDR